MRVLVLTQHFEPEENAPAFRWSWLVDAFADRGVTVDVVTAAWAKDAADSRGVHGRVTVHRVRNVLKGAGLARRLVNEFAVAAKSLAEVLRLPRPDVVIVTAPPVGAMLWAGPLATVLRRPLVLEVRDAWPEILKEWRTWSDYGSGPRPHWLRDALVRSTTAVLHPMLSHARGRADMVVTTTQSYAEHLRASGLDNVLCIRNGARTQPPAHRRDFDGVLRVLYMGNVGRAQLLATAIRAAAHVRASGGDMVLRIVGHGAHLTAVRNLASRLQAPVEFHAPISRSEVRSQYDWADSVLVMLRAWEPMRWTVPSKLYEVIRARKHVSASVFGEAAELVAASGAGDVVPPEDATALATLWMGLADDPERLRPTGDVAEVEAISETETLAATYVEALKALAREADSA